MNEDVLFVAEDSISREELREEMVGAPARYRVERILGGGGMADVFLCTMLGGATFARLVAVKFVREAFAKDPDFSAMFIEEARLSSHLEHPNIVHVEYFGSDRRGRPFLVMEYIDGRDLAAIMRNGPLPYSLAIFIAGEVLRGLGHAHQVPQRDGRRGLVHRDVSPQNILLSRDGSVKIADFGIAKALTSAGPSGLKGKASYMSPEQITGDRMDGRSDLFAVGIVLWEMLTGVRLFPCSASKEGYASVIFKPIPPPSRERPVPSDVERVALRLLAKNPAERYARAEDALAELLRCEDAPRDGHGELAALLAGGVPLPESGKAAIVTLADPPAGGEKLNEISPPNRTIAAVGAAGPAGGEKLNEISLVSPMPKRASVLLAALGVAIVVVLVVTGTVLGLQEPSSSSAPSPVVEASPVAGPAPVVEPAAGPAPVLEASPVAGPAPAGRARLLDPPTSVLPEPVPVRPSDRRRSSYSTMRKFSPPARPAPEPASGIYRVILKDGVPET
jgi:Protein kinase domain